MDELDQARIKQAIASIDKVTQIINDLCESASDEYGELSIAQQESSKGECLQEFIDNLESIGESVDDILVHLNDLLP